MNSDKQNQNVRHSQGSVAASKHWRSLHCFCDESEVSVSLQSIQISHFHFISPSLIRSLPRIVTFISFTSSVPAVPTTEIATEPSCGHGHCESRQSFALMAAPKKKPSHARRRIRQHGQRLMEERKNPIVQYAF
jgi:hypothetical protein